jgi:hypothetical protein
MTPTQEYWLQIDNYLSELRKRLPRMPVQDREEIVREISAHIRECAQEPGSNIEDILKRLGSPAMVAAEYGHDRLMRRASRSFSPLLILRVTLALARRGVEGLALFFGTVLGYSMGVGLVVTALLKPIFPRNVGLWIGNKVLDFGFRAPSNTIPEHEVLGPWYVPIALALGYFFIWLTTYGIRWYLRRSRQRAPLFTLGKLVQTVV